MPEVVTEPRDDAISKKLQDALTVHDESEGARQIPEVKFIENVEELCATSGYTTDDYVSLMILCCI